MGAGTGQGWLRPLRGQKTRPRRPGLAAPADLSGCGAHPAGSWSTVYMATLGWGGVSLWRQCSCEGDSKRRPWMGSCQPARCRALVPQRCSRSPQCWWSFQCGAGLPSCCVLAASRAKSWPGIPHPGRGNPAVGLWRWGAGIHSVCVPKALASSFHKYSCG